MPTIVSVREHIAWSYANLARAHAALDDGCIRYRPYHHMIRAKLYKGLCTGSMRVGSLFDDERIKLTTPPGCAHCGARNAATIDHLIPRRLGGGDDGDNLILACRACNSAKGGRDMLLWYGSRDAFPSLMLVRRYLKIVMRYCDEHGLLDRPLTTVTDADLPFALSALPHDYPGLAGLRLWATTRDV